MNYFMQKKMYDMDYFLQSEMYDMDSFMQKRGLLLGGAGASFLLKGEAPVPTGPKSNPVSVHPYTLVMLLLQPILSNVC